MGKTDWELFINSVDRIKGNKGELAAYLQELEGLKATVGNYKTNLNRLHVNQEPINPAISQKLGNAYANFMELLDKEIAHLRELLH